MEFERSYCNARNLGSVLSVEIMYAPFLNMPDVCVKGFCSYLKKIVRYIWVSSAKITIIKQMCVPNTGQYK